VSIAVGPEELRDRVAAYGPAAFLVTVNEAGRPHVVSVRVALEGDALLAGAGRTTAANVAGRPDVTLLWSPAPDGYSLIVDGPAALRGDEVVVTPVRAVLHRTVVADPAGPSCITVLDAR
jgi:hypothetical protein